METDATVRQETMEDDGNIAKLHSSAPSETTVDNPCLDDDSNCKEPIPSDMKTVVDKIDDNPKGERKVSAVPNVTEHSKTKLSTDLPTCHIGDLMWASVSGKPSSWWPAMVTYDPDRGVYFQYKKGRILEYHVQWFGKGALRSWVQASRMERLISTTQYDISKRKSGMVALNEVERALPLSLRERKCGFIFNFGTSKPLPPLPSMDINKPPNSIASKLVAVKPRRQTKKKSRTKSISTSTSSSTSSSSSSGSMDVNVEPPVSVLETRDQPMEVEESRDADKSTVHSESSCSVTNDSLPLTIPLPTPPSSSSPTQSDDDVSSGGDHVLYAESRKRPTPPTSTESADMKRVCPPAIQSQSSTDEESVSSSKERATPLLQSGLCIICLVEGNRLIACSQCNQTAHHDCMGLRRLPASPFVCDDCILVGLTCFYCKSSEGELLPCSYNACVRRYHRRCINSIDGFKTHTSGSFSCPLHYCVRCAAADERTNPPRAPLVSCSKCLLTLHNHNQCLIAGCEITGNRSMVCYKHLKRTTHNDRKNPIPVCVNLDWCYTCGNGGTLVCCDLCSSAYHEECISSQRSATDVSAPTSDRWVCPDCTRYQMLTYGSLAWCKCGKHRWWPCEVVPPKQVPDHLMKLKPNPLMFLVRFFGTNEHCWTHHGRCVPYHMDTEGSPRVFDSTGSIKKVAALKNALQEIAERAKSLSLSQKTSKKHGQLKTNRYLVPPPPCDMQFEMCSCTEDSPCDDDSKCVNRAVKIECSSSSCRLGDKCQNRRMQKMKQISTVPFYTGCRGWGLKATRDIKSGEFVIEYVGEVIDDEMCRDRLKKYREDGKQCFYILSLDRGLYIDAAMRANKARFINHSCQPNLETQKWIVDKRTRIGLFAVCDIPAGVELTFDYQLDTLGHVKMKCHCGAPNCSGFLGEKAKTTTSTKANGKKKHSKKRP